MTDQPRFTKQELLEVIATICEQYPKDSLNNDVADGIAFAVGYLLAQAGDDQ